MITGGLFLTIDQGYFSASIITHLYDIDKHDPADKMIFVAIDEGYTFL